MIENSTSLGPLKSVAQATFSERAELIEANAGFLRLVNLAGATPVKKDVARFFIQPHFEALLSAPPDEEGLVYEGLLTIGEYAEKTRTLCARVWREGAHLHVLAEHDIEDLERLNTTVLNLNRDYTRAQVELAQTNLKLQATNARLMDTQKMLVEAEKMASLGTLVAGVAHEINTPLGVSLAAVSLLQEDSRLLEASFAKRSLTQADLTHYLERCKDSSTLISSNLARIGRLIDTFRQVAVGAKSFETKPFKLRECLDNVVSSFGGRLSSGKVQAQIDCAAELVVKGNADEWATIFTNLIDNSLRHGFKGREQGHIHIHVAHGAEGLQVHYRDDGMGMTPHIKTRIFDPFFTTDLQNGMGLGMHLVFNLVAHRFGGHISCESEPGVGTRIHIKVPS